jgi:CubicO group peptidase (beta-lactamase class C family)
MRTAILVSCLILSGCDERRQPDNAVTASSPAPITDEWAIGSPADAGLNTNLIQKLLTEIRSGIYKNIHSILIIKSGKLVVEEYFPGREEDGQYREYNRNTLHAIHSATKSVNSILVGIAIDQQRVVDVETKASALFPKYNDLFADQEKDAIRLKHLLSMTAGLSWDEWTFPYTDARNDHVALNQSDDPVRYVFSRPMVAQPGTRFNYNSGIAIALGEFVRNLSGSPADQFAEQFLFKPLGISNYRWIKYPNGIVQTGGGLYMRPRDMAKIGLLYLNNGRWQGRQIVSEHWIRESITQHAPDRDYGYQWWLGRLHSGHRSVFTYGAQGRGGQFILVMPDLEMVAVFTGWNDGNGLGEQPYDMLQRFVIPAALRY